MQPSSAECHQSVDCPLHVVLVESMTTQQKYPATISIENLNEKSCLQATVDGLAKENKPHTGNGRNQNKHMESQITPFGEEK